MHATTALLTCCRWMHSVDWLFDHACCACMRAGMRVLPEGERQEMLAILAKNREEVEKAIQKLPFVIETPSQIR